MVGLIAEEKTLTEVKIQRGIFSGDALSSLLLIIAMIQLNHILVKNDPIYPTPPLGQDMTQGQFLKRILAGLNSEFSFS